MSKPRFSLLLLEPGEIYFEDFSVICYVVPPQSGEAVKEGSGSRGWLKLCSKSLFFDPTSSSSTSDPILKIPFQDCLNVTSLPQNQVPLLFKSESTENLVLQIETKQCIEMLAAGALAPYTFPRKPQVLIFVLNFASMEYCMSRIGQLRRACSLPFEEQRKMITAIVSARHRLVAFDPCWLEDLQETVLLQLQGHKITPLVTNPGRVLLTNLRLYFQPYNNVEPYPVLKIRLADIERIVRRRYLLTPVGLEVYCHQCSPVRHLFLALNNADDVENLVTTLQSQASYSGSQAQPEQDLDRVRLQWQHGVISNYEYLLYLNSVADRSFNDITQYPVFPWIVADYSSPKLDLTKPATFRDLTKPIGALNQDRLTSLKSRYEEMSEPKFLYGSHYLAPGFVLFYLARSLSQLVLCLHGGRFDHPDRMFNSVQQTWSNVTQSMSDYKEIIPEFYDEETQGEFLLNIHGIQFGKRHNGQEVGDVELPPWATDAGDFVKKLREALESDYVSQFLHCWIDLIFGYQQRGEEAVKAHNVYHPLCYEGGVDWTSITDVTLRHQYEVQILEFGQIPRQIFLTPHPPRWTVNCPGIPRNRFLTAPLQGKAWIDWPALQLTHVFQGHKRSITGVAVTEDAEDVLSVSQDTFLKMYHLADGKQVRSLVVLPGTPLTTCCLQPDAQSESDNLRILLGTSHNSMISYNLACCRVEGVSALHEDEIVSLVYHQEKQMLISASSDTTVKIWTWNGQDKLKPNTHLKAEVEHNASVTCADLSKDGNWLLAGTDEGEVCFWNLKTYHMEHSWQSGETEAGKSAIVSVKFNPKTSDSALYVTSHGVLTMLDLQTFSTLYSQPTESRLRCSAWDGYRALLGTTEGELLLWDLWALKPGFRLAAHTGAVTALCVTADGKCIVSAGDDLRVCVWKPL